MLHALLDLGLSLLSPPRCAACDAPVGLRSAFCGGCATSVERSRGAAAFVYGGAMSEAIGKLKYGGRADLGRVLGGLMVERLRGLEVDVVTPVPLHRSRLLERGYNQSALLAAPVASALGVPLGAQLLARNRPTPKQATLDRAARRLNVAGAFVASSEVRGRRVLLIDDVRTTGATLEVCVEALEQAGAASVEARALAEALGPDGFRAGQRHATTCR